MSGVRLFLAASLLVLGAASLPLIADSVPPDNGKMNRTEQPQATAETRQNDTTDRDLTRHTRQRLMADKSLSTYAQNVEIVSVSGTVTLNDPVRSQAEKKTIGRRSGSVAGRSKMVTDLTVAPDH